MEKSKFKFITVIVIHSIHIVFFFFVLCLTIGRSEEMLWNVCNSERRLDGEVFDIDDELEVEEELPEHEDINGPGCNEVVEQEPNITIPVSSVRRSAGENNSITSVKLAMCPGKRNRRQQEHDIGFGSPEAAPDKLDA